MTIEQLKAAHARGAVIQGGGCSGWTLSGWTDNPSPAFDMPASFYRVKPGTDPLDPMFDASAFHPHADVAGGPPPDAGMTEPERCLWQTDSDDGLHVGMPYQTACGHAFEFTWGGPKANKFGYCCYCGKEIEVKE